MADSTKKFLDYSGVSILWDRIKDKVAAEEARAKAAEEAAASAAAQAQSEVDALETYVGTFTAEGTYADVTTVVGYIDKKAEETLKAATGGSGETADTVAAALQSYKNEVNPKLTDYEERISAIEDDYLVEADKTELNNAIGANTTEIARVNSVLVNAIENNAEGLDSIKELATWIESHGTDAAGYAAAISALEAKVDTGDLTVSAYVAQEIGEVETVINQNITNIEQKLGLDEEDTETIKEQIAAAKSEAISESKGYTDNAFNNIPALSESEIDAAIAEAESAS